MLRNFPAQTKQGHFDIEHRMKSCMDAPRNHKSVFLLLFVHNSGKDTTSSNSLLCYEILLSSPQNLNHYPCTRARRNDKASSIGLSSDSIHQETMSLTSSLVRCSSEEDFQSARQSLHHYLTAVVHNGCFTHFLLRSFYAILFSASSFPIICRCYGLHSIGNFQPYLPLSIHRNARDVAKKSTPQPQ